MLSRASSANRIAVSAALRWHSIKFVIVIYAIHAHIQTCIDTCVYTLRSPLIRSLQAHTHMHCGAPLCELVCAYTAEHVYKTL